MTRDKDDDLTEVWIHVCDQTIFFVTIQICNYKTSPIVI